jgi:hypothetical protein
MLGLMQSQPLLISSLDRIRGATTATPKSSRAGSKATSTATPTRPGPRARRVAQALDGLGCQPSATASPRWPGTATAPGAVLRRQRLGPRAAHHQPAPAPRPDRLDRQPREDQVLCFDLSFLPLVQAVARPLPDHQALHRAVRRRQAAGRPGMPNLQSYESWIGAQAADYAWPEFDENTASSMCYTSGTTGNPKAALYSHRSTRCTPTPPRCPT